MGWKIWEEKKRTKSDSFVTIFFSHFKKKVVWNVTNVRQSETPTYNKRWRIRYIVFKTWRRWHTHQLSVSLFHTHTLTLTHAHTHTHTFISLSLSLSISLSHTYTHIFIFLLRTHTHTFLYLLHTHTWAHTHFYLSPTHARTHEQRGRERMKIVFSVGIHKTSYANS